MNEQAGTATRYDVVQGDSTHRQRAELQGQPVFNSLVGPMFDGKRGDSVQVIRYEVAR